jgi:quinol---cytochrome c reductase iron-sulfur subunit, bacillus type
MAESPLQQPDTHRPPIERRSFLTRAAAVILGGIAALFPFAVGLFTFADPLRRRANGEGDGFIRIASLSAVPDDGVPQQFPVVADRVDAWSRLPNEAIGVVYLVRKPGQETPTAFNAICPHAGCFVTHSATRNLFQCPCHNSAFTLDGSIIQPSPSPRDMDELTCAIRQAGANKEVWVKFQNYLAGRQDQIPIG